MPPTPSPSPSRKVTFRCSPTPQGAYGPPGTVMERPMGHSGSDTRKVGSAWGPTAREFQSTDVLTPGTHEGQNQYPAGAHTWSNGQSGMVDQNAGGDGNGGWAFNGTRQVTFWGGTGQQGASGHQALPGRFANQGPRGGNSVRPAGQLGARDHQIPNGGFANRGTRGGNRGGLANRRGKKGGRGRGRRSW